MELRRKYSIGYKPSHQLFSAFYSFIIRTAVLDHVYSVLNYWEYFKI